MRDTELTDEQWERIRALLPPPHKGRGRPRADDRKVLNGISYVLRTGCRWEDVPRKYASPATCWRRLRQWEQDGTWERIWRALLSTLDEQGKLGWSRAFLEGSFIPAKRGDRRWGARSGEEDEVDGSSGWERTAEWVAGGQRSTP